MYLTFLKAVVIILKHATLLWLSNIPPGLALIRAELEYQEANTNSKIHEHLMVSSQELSIEQFADFIMATDIGWSLLVFLKIISHQAFSLASAIGWSTCACWWCCLNSFCYNLDPVFSFLPPSPYCHLIVLVSPFPLSIDLQLFTIHATSLFCSIWCHDLSFTIITCLPLIFALILKQVL